MGGMATNANISVGSVALDAAGNLIFPDYEHHSIRKVDTNGIITTIAGGGTNEVVDGALSTNVALSAGNVAVDAAGNIFAYLEDAMIRKIDTQGVITTAAGNGTSGYSGDGGAATNASLAGGFVAVDNVGNLFISDSVNSRIRKVDTNGIINTIAGITPLAILAMNPPYSVPSPPFILTVATTPMTSRWAVNPDGNVALDFVSPPGSTNVVLCATNLAPSVWQALSTNVAGPDGDWQFTDVQAAAPARFYRFVSR